MYCSVCDRRMPKDSFEWVRYNIELEILLSTFVLCRLVFGTLVGRGRVVCGCCIVEGSFPEARQMKLRVLEVL